MRRTWLSMAAGAALLVAACSTAVSPTATTAPTAEPTASPTPIALPAPGKILRTGKVVGSEIPLTADQEALIKATSKGKLVGIVATTMSTAYHKLLNEAAQKRAQDLGYTAEICDSTIDTAKALQCFEGFVQKGATIIMTSSSAETLGAAVKEATGKGIIVVQVTGTDLGDAGAITLSVDNISIGLAEGKGAGEYAAKTWPDQAVEAIILDYPDFASLIDRADAIETAMLAANAKITVDGRFKGGTADLGVANTEIALQKFPNFKILVGINDGGDLGGYQALVAAGKGPADVAVFGIDCDPQAVALIDQGTMYKGCVDTNPSGTGLLAINAANRLLAGADVPGFVEVPVTVYAGK